MIKIIALHPYRAHSLYQVEPGKAKRIKQKVQRGSTENDNEEPKPGRLRTFGEDHSFTPPNNHALLDKTPTPNSF
jgi:hypothetical protein